MNTIDDKIDIIINGVLEARKSKNIVYLPSLFHLLYSSTSTMECLKVAFIQKVLMHLSFPQTDEPYYLALTGCLIELDF